MADYLPVGGLEPELCHEVIADFLQQVECLLVEIDGKSVHFLDPFMF